MTILWLCLKNPGHAKSHGQGAIETVLSLLMFVMLVGSLMSISFYMYIHHLFLTAAKEGARFASVETNLASNGATYNTGVDSVKNRVISFVQSGGGITLATSNISITGPTGTSGNRTVSVAVNYSFQNPVQIRTFINRLGGGNQTGLDTFTIANTASMRYEE